VARFWSALPASWVCLVIRLWSALGGLWICSCGLEPTVSTYESSVGGGRCSLTVCDPQDCVPSPVGVGWDCSHNWGADLACYLECGIDAGGAKCPDPDPMRVRTSCWQPCTATFPPPHDDEYKACMANCIDHLTTQCVAGGDRLTTRQEDASD